MIKYIISAVFIAALSSPGWADDPAKPLRLVGSTSVANGAVLPHKAEIENTAKVKIAVLPSSSGDGLAKLASGEADIAMISADLDEILEKVKPALDANKLDRGQLQTHRVSENHVEFIVNEGNASRKLSAGQLKAIFLGSITNWKDAGGPDAPISAVSESRQGAMRAIIEHDLLGGAKMADSVVETRNALEVPRLVAMTPNSIGFISASIPKAARGGTATVETDVSLTQHLALVTRGQPDDASRRVIEAIAGLQ